MPDSNSIDTNTDSNSHVTPILLTCLFISAAKVNKKTVRSKQIQKKEPKNEGLTTAASPSY